MSDTLTFPKALNKALTQAMAEDPSVMLLGENIRGQGRGEMRGLQAAYGDGRVIDFPISEAAMTGFGNFSSIRRVSECHPGEGTFSPSAISPRSCPAEKHLPAPLKMTQPIVSSFFRSIIC